ncbi:uncharacterized protein LOC131315568 [Rhododendron vialii]|uniref:uncharacterized protein LOC131315568 n=1 Tax=Rhododendron vialii TaxID=182163 RepID=UPI00265E3F93|nr:uncharacterized protein LOC131315568 [Rhododendron vialii]
MGSFSTVTRSSAHYLQLQDYPDLETHEFTLETMEEEDDANPPTGFSRNPKKTKSNKSRNVFLEGYVEAAEDDDLTRTKSLTDEDLEELKGCLDLGFGFSYEEIPELCNTLPALELCYSMNQRFLDEQQRSPESAEIDACSSASSGPIANWKISSPGDHPEDVKARLKYWAQAVACTVRLCS